MALWTTESIEKILEVLKKDEITTIVLHGKRGVGKTQMAREIRMKNDSIYDSLWLYLNNKYDGESLRKSIACQLFRFFIHDEWEYDDDTEENESLENLVPKISEKLEELTSAADKQNKPLLLILDDVPHEQDVEAIMSELKQLLHSNERSLKVLITKDESDSRPVTDKGRKEEIQSYTWLYNMYIEQLSTEESKILLRDNVKKEISDSPSFELLSKVIVEMRKCMPNEIIEIAKALNHIGHVGSGVWSLESVLEAAADNEESAIKLLLRSWYETLPGGVLTDCFWHSMQLFSKHAGVHYNELITHWIIEGFIGCTDHIEKAYEQGHRVLMELVDLGMLRKHEDDMVVMGGLVSGITDHRRRGFNGTASLGLANVFEDDKCWEGFGRLKHADGMIKSPCTPKSWGKALTLLMDGRCLSRQVPDKYFQPMQSLQVLTIFNPRFRTLPSSLPSIKSLSILVLRCCDILEKIDHIGELKNLTVLEMSGATCLKEVPDNLFANMPHLRSLNLSGASITSLPSSLFDKRELRWLILRRCSQLKELPSLRFFNNLMVLDLSGATSFQKFLDKTFAPLSKIQSIDLSNSQINRLPSLHNLSKLTHLLLGGCASLRRLPTLNTLPRLQILDLSGTTGLKEIQEEPLDSLKVLDLSETQISRLPSSTSDLSNLYLRDCSELVKLHPIGAIKELELLNLSGSRKLAETEDKSLQNLRYLRVLNFSKVKVKELPSMSNLVNLHELLLIDCSSLEKLPQMEGLKRLRVLNLSGCVALVDLPHLNALKNLQILDASGCSNLIRLPPLGHLSKLEELNLHGAISLVDFEAEFLEHMVHLQILDLSGTSLTKLPPMSNLKNLRQLSLKSCSRLEAVQNLEALTELEILDLSGTAIGCLPVLNNFSSLRQLLLKDCLQIEELQQLGSLIHLQVLDLSGTRLKRFPYEISELTDLKLLHLPDLRSMHDLDVGKISWMPQEVNWDECGILEHADISVDSDKSPISVSGAEIFQFLDKNPKYWETKFKRFQFFVTTKTGEDGDVISCKDGLFFRDVYSRTRNFGFPGDRDRSLEIHGSHSLPNGFESVLKHAECISLVDNHLISRLSDLGADTVEVMKGCWIERCDKILSLFGGEEANVRLGSRLEILWISNLSKLSSLYNGKVEPECFKNLKHLYLDCCPMIFNVFPSSELPENLESVHVQFCDRLKTLVDPPSDCTLKKLRTVYLLELPEMRSTGIELPDEVTFEAIECPKLGNFGK